MMRSTAFLLLVMVITVPSVAAAMAQPSGKSDSPREVALVIWPARIDEGPKALTVLPKAADLTDADAAAFYNKAVKALPATLQRGQVTYWAREPFRNLPLDRDEAQAALQQTQTSLDLVERGAKCKTYNGPAFVPGTLPPNLSEYRLLNDLFCLKARIEILQSQYEKAAGTIGTGLAMSKHIGEGPTVIQGMTGIVMATFVMGSVEDWVQVQGAPNLYRALHALPRPVVDVNVGVSAELKNLESSTQYNSLTKAVFRRQLENSFAAVRRSMERLDGMAAALECVEGLRHFAACHDGQLPAQLSDVTDVQLPNDPATGKPFLYRIEGSKAVLEASAPKGGGPRDVLRYTITVAR